MRVFTVSQAAKALSGTYETIIDSNEYGSSVWIKTVNSQALVASSSEITAGIDVDQLLSRAKKQIAIEDGRAINSGTQALSMNDAINLF